MAEMDLNEDRFWNAIGTLVADEHDAHIMSSFFADRHVLYLSGLQAEGSSPDEVIVALHDAMLEELNEAAERVA
jgi:hypothetical protein